MTVDFKGNEVNQGTDRNGIEMEVDNKECDRKINHTFQKHAI